MRQLATLILVFCVYGSQAQITLDSADFATAGDSFKVVAVGNPATIDVSGGANHNWDFSSLSVDSIRQVRTRGIDPGNYPQDVLFPNSSMKIESESYGNAYLTKTADSLVMDGVADFEVILGNFFTFQFNPALKMMDFPASYNDKFFTVSTIDTVVDTTVLSFDSLRIIVDFGIETEVEGWGTLKTPQYTESVLKSYTIESQGFEVYGHIASVGWSTTPFLTQRDTFHVYRWFAKNRGYQIAEARSDVKNGTVLTASYLLSDSLFVFISDSSNPSCYGLSDGEATVSAIGGSGNYSYKWSHSTTQQGSTATGLAEGVYTCTVTDILTQKSLSATAQLKQPDSLSIVVTDYKEAFKDPTSGYIQIRVSGGTPSYTYVWDRSTSSTNRATGLEAGEHVVSITDKNGCMKDTTIALGPPASISQSDMAKIGFRLYPNPVQGGEVFIEFEELPTNAYVELLDLSGKRILEQPVTSEKMQFDISSLKAGTYIIRLEGEGFIDTRQLIVLE